MGLEPLDNIVSSRRYTEVFSRGMTACADFQILTERFSFRGAGPGLVFAAGGQGHNSLSERLSA